MIPAGAPNFAGHIPRLPFTTPPFLSDNSRFRPCGHGPHQGSWPGVAGNGPIRHRARGAPCPRGSFCTSCTGTWPGLIRAPHPAAAALLHETSRQRAVDPSSGVSLQEVSPVAACRPRRWQVRGRVRPSVLYPVPSS